VSLQEAQVTDIFLKQEKNVMVTLEAVELKENKLIWTGTLTAPGRDMLALQNQLEKKVRQDCCLLLGVARAAMESSQTPGIATLMRVPAQTSMAHEAGPTRCDKMLEKAVGLDPNYAPAWKLLGRRYYFDAIYANGGSAQYERSNASYKRALSLEPGRIGAAGFLATNEVEMGQLDKAYRSARDLWRGRPR